MSHPNREPAAFAEAVKSPPLLHFAYNGVVVIRAGDHVLRCTGTLEMSDEHLEGVVAEMDGVGRNHTLDGMYDEAHIEAEDGSWTSDRVGVMAHASGSQISPTYRIVTSSVEHNRQRHDDVAFTRELYFGLELQSARRWLGTRGDGVNAENFLQVRVFGREGAFYKAADKHGEPVLALVYEGAPLEERDRWALHWLVSYLAGRRGGMTATELLGNDATRIGFSISFRGQGSRSTILPLNLTIFPGSDAPRVSGVFEDILLRVRQLFDNEGRQGQRRMMVSLHLYHDGADSHYPVTRGRSMVVAIDALSALVIGTNREIIVSPAARFEAGRAALEAAIDGITNDDGERRELKNNIGKVNERAAGDRRRAFFAFLGITLDGDDRRVLRVRNPAVHEGFFGPDDREIEGLMEVASTADRLTDLFNRAMLSFIGYDGPYRTQTVEDGRHRVAPVRDAFPDESIDRITSRAGGLTATMRPAVTHQLAEQGLMRF